MTHEAPKRRKPVAALPIRIHSEGRLRFVLVTSRGTKRFIIPEGCPMKGQKNHRPEAVEARQDAEIIGRAHKKPVGVTPTAFRHHPAFPSGVPAACPVDVGVQP